MPHNLDVLVVIGNPPDDYGHINCVHYLLYRCCYIGGRTVVPVRVGALGLDHDYLGPVVLHALARPGRRIAQDTAEGRLGRFGPVLARVFVPDFHCDTGSIGDRSFE